MVGIDTLSKAVLSKPHLFLISGLGADHRAFARLNLEEYELTHLHWIMPEDTDDLSSYARKMARPVLSANNPVVIGVSFGGMIATEMTTFIPHMRAILISSIKSPEERSKLLRFGDRMNMKRDLPVGLLKKMSFLWGWMKFRLPKKDRVEMLSMFRQTDNRFLGWAVKTIPKWKGKGDNTRIHHIHGDRDRMFPIKRIKNAVVIEGGTHLMIMTRAQDVNELLHRELKRIREEIILKTKT